jgi:hypothetical protein
MIVGAIPVCSFDQTAYGRYYGNLSLNGAGLTDGVPRLSPTEVARMPIFHSSLDPHEPRDERAAEQSAAGLDWGPFHAT